MDQARGRDRRRYDGSHCLRRDPVSSRTDAEGSRKAGPRRFSRCKSVLLGTAAGGGFPQWNCWCPTCRAARLDPRSAFPRSQSSTAVSADGSHWFLLNASPDVRDQVQQLNGHPPSGNRHVPIEGVVLTDADLDDSPGLVLLREGRSLQLYATAAVERMVTEDSRLLSVARAFADVRVTRLQVGTATALTLRDGTEAGLTGSSRWWSPLIHRASPPVRRRVTPWASSSRRRLPAHAAPICQDAGPLMMPCLRDWQEAR